MGLSNLDLEKLLIEIQILKNQVAKILNCNIWKRIGTDISPQISRDTITTTGKGNFGNSKQAIIGDDSNYSGSFTDGTNTTTICDGTVAQAWTDGIHDVKIFDGTYLLNVDSNGYAQNLANFSASSASLTIYNTSYYNTLMYATSNSIPIFYAEDGTNQVGIADTNYAIHVHQGDSYINGNVGIGGTPSSDIPLRVESSDTDNMTVNFDGTTNDRTATTGTIYGIYNALNHNCGSGNTPATLQGFANWHYLKHENADISSGGNANAMYNLLNDSATWENDEATNQTLNLRSFLNSVILSGTYNSTGTGYTRVRGYGGNTSITQTGTFSASGGATNQSLLYGDYISVNHSPTLASGNLTVRTYGQYIYVIGTTVGNSRNYGLYIGGVSGADSNYGIWDASGADWVLDGDNQKILLGEGQDASIYYDGTNMIINPAEVGSGSLKIGGSTNYAEIKSDGEINLHGTARVLRDLWIDSAGIKAPGSKPATEISFGNLENSAWQFDNQALEANQESVSWRIAPPYDMDRTQGITIRLGWSSASTGNAKWRLEYKWLSENEDTTQGADETLTAVDAASTTENGLVVTDISGIDAPSSTDASIIFRLTRLSADASDTISDTIELHGICFNYTSNKLGESLV
ncbi:MAG: hypothetical protein ACTSUC_09745 [Promethearchaeota archaeon]